MSAAQDAEVVAVVPVHPRNGPLWSMTTADPDPERLPHSYPLMKLYGAAQEPVPPAQVRAFLAEVAQCLGELLKEADRPSSDVPRKAQTLEMVARLRQLAEEPKSLDVPRP
jgi:hypothetical protein